MVVGTNGYAVIGSGKATYEPLRFDGAAIERDAFDLGIDPQGRVIIAYKADLPDKHPDAQAPCAAAGGDRWSPAEKIGGEGEHLSGSVHVVWGAERTLVTWLVREEYTERGGVLVKGFRRFSIDDGNHGRPRAGWRVGPLRGNGVPITAQYPAFCVDRDGCVHMCDETFSYCLIAKLGSTNKAVGRP